MLSALSTSGEGERSGLMKRRAVVVDETLAFMRPLLPRASCAAG
jgi:hypothetical protein